MQRRPPGPEVLCGEILAHRILQILVDLAGIDGVKLARVIQVLKQMLSQQLMASPHEARESLVVNGDLVLGAALAAKAEQQPSVRNEPDMPVAQRRESVAAVVALVLGIADAHPRRVEQAYDEREYLFPR